MPLVGSDGQTDSWLSGEPRHNGSGGDFKATAVMLRRQLEEMGFPAMRESL